VADDRPGRDRTLPVVWLAAFGRFWWDFLIGDTPELFVGAAAVVGAVALMCLRPDLRRPAAFVAPVLVAAVVTVSVWRASRRR
jgi:hypothetical protein